MIKDKISNLDILSSKLDDILNDDIFLNEVYYSNNWFDKINVTYTIQNIKENFLNSQKLYNWLESYNFDNNNSNETIGIISAGNIPLVGFHDFLCAYILDKNIKLKYSSKDNILFKKIIDLLLNIDRKFSQKFESVIIINNIDKIIATGSNNSNRYFDYYFGKYKSLLRHNRTSIAIIENTISENQLISFLDDIFIYFGLGCRNVSKIYFELGFDIKRIFDVSYKYKHVFDHKKYMNNYDYQRTLLLLNKVEHLCNEFLILKEDKQLFSPISIINYEYFNNINDLNKELSLYKEDIQCIISKDDISFGNSQKTLLENYSDNIDTINFLLN